MLWQFMIMTTDSFSSFLESLSHFLKIESHQILYSINESIPQVNIQRHRKISDAVRGSKDHLLFRISGSVNGSPHCPHGKAAVQGCPNTSLHCVSCTKPSTLCFLEGLWGSKYIKRNNFTLCYPESISFLLNESIANVCVCMFTE